jgi:hypothetical protein
MWNTFGKTVWFSYGINKKRAVAKECGNPG